jgi:GNAT superfamily N-acetyltransferase
MTDVDKTIKVEKVDPETFTRRKALPYADLVLRVFDGDPLFSYWFGPNYRYGNAQLLTAYADCLVAYVLDGMLFYVLTDMVSGELLGISMWVPPEAQLKQSHHDHYSFKWRFRKFTTHVGLGLSYVWNWGLPNLSRRIVGRSPVDHPLYNDRLSQFYEGFNKVADRVGENERPLKRLSELSYHQLATTPYRKKDMYYLSVLVIRPEHQKKGLGTHFLRETLNRLSKEPVQFVWENRSSVGPQKVYVNSSDGACHLYRKLGFLELCNYRVSLDECEISITRLEKVMGMSSGSTSTSLTKILEHAEQE